MSNDLQIRSFLKRLRLPVVAQNYSRLAEEAAANNQTFQDYLFALLEGEVIQREDHAQKLRLLRALFPVIKSLDNFDFSAIPSANKAPILELSRSTFIDRRENVILIGSYGTDKTHLAISLAASTCRQGKKVRFYTVAGLINELLEAGSKLKLGKLESALAKCDLILLDELGFVPFGKEGAEALFTFCSSRYERSSLIITTNLDFARWKEIFN
ncbi:IS21-like element helper ATPase IstB [Dehalogenimonas etheniformans]|uniref:AAA family ATPase n=1 Tax=Dehalogenimonas etheniformans TaxID=1536648 RepID=A0A2P5P804_9CHLR|nr:IS21-like element helper ATPase IstB [Dehalogenimonas etheniformans]PPD58416.1 AAA family ATPase [Dehalogenimonas etheniformans]QNT76990.1 ATP-binding protein [Dehalogenimonas etheniformans]